MMEATASLRRARISPRKVRIILNAIRNEPVDVALSQLRLTNKRAARVVYKLLASAVANANVRYGTAEPSKLYISQAFADEGPTLRRFRPRAMGRATRINKRTSHITVTVALDD
tara:strand:- start:1596 stop:1937 length:342 start_codon:yes stop_codon:yes gene_type:complete